MLRYAALSCALCIAGIDVSRVSGQTGSNPVPTSNTARGSDSHISRSLGQRNATAPSSVQPAASGQIAGQREPEVFRPLAQPVLPETIERLSKNDSKKGESWLQGVEQWVGPKGLSQSIQTLLLLTLLSAAPAAILMTTCYVRVVIVLGVLKQAIGNQDSTMGADQAWERGIAPVHRFMARQIAMAGNYEDVHLFYSRYSPNTTPPENFESVPLIVLLPAYMLSELKTAFLMGFQIYLPFLVLDLVIAAVIASMGLSQLSPATISIPF